MKLSTACNGGVVLASRASFASFTVSAKHLQLAAFFPNSSTRDTPCPAAFSSSFTEYPEIFRAI